MLFVPVSETGGIARIDCRAALFGAEILVLGRKEGDIGVNGSSEADGDGDKVAERSPARAANSGRTACGSKFWRPLKMLSDPKVRSPQRKRRFRSSSESWAAGELSPSKHHSWSGGVRRNTGSGVTSVSRRERCGSAEGRGVLTIALTFAGRGGAAVVEAGGWLDVRLLRYHRPIHVNTARIRLRRLQHAALCWY
jgi:hypothetical protein